MPLGDARQAMTAASTKLWGRRESPEPTICECGWAGPRMAAIHEYESIGRRSDGEVEPVDLCPRCGKEAFSA